MSTLSPLIDFVPTKYYFDTFVLGAHHSVPHLIYDLQNRKELVLAALEKDQTNHKESELRKLLQMIGNALDSLDIHDVDQMEDTDQVYWVNQLGRQSALEISTYGRIRPETMNLLMCLSEEDFIHVMSIAGKLANRIQQLGDGAMSLETPIPPNMPVAK